ncbi:hypothetical protein ABBQ32_005715 [Trebouxia sp. C0010 RCD-2024]
MSRTSDTQTSSTSGYWSASSHSTVRSWSGEIVEPTERQELDLLASETLSLSDDDCASTATPTFSDKSEAPQAVAARNSGALSVEDIAKQLDFGSVTVLAQVGSHDATPHQTDALAACGESVSENLACSTAKDEAAASQTLITLCPDGSDSDSSSSIRVLQSTAASARPSCKRRAALESDSESEQVSARHQKAITQLLPQVPSSSVYNFEVSDSEHTSDADTPVSSGSCSPLEVSTAKPASCQPEKGAALIVLDSSEDDNATPWRRHSYLLCSSDSDEELSTAHKENLSPNQLALRLHSLHIRPTHTCVKPPKPPSTAHRPRVPQSLPPKAKHAVLVPSSPAPSKALPLATFKKQREGLAYEMFRE